MTAAVPELGPACPSPAACSSCRSPSFTEMYLARDITHVPGVQWRLNVHLEYEVIATVKGTPPSPHLRLFVGMVTFESLAPFGYRIPCCSFYSPCCTRGPRTNSSLVGRCRPQGQTSGCPSFSCAGGKSLCPACGSDETCSCGESSRHVPSTRVEQPGTFLGTGHSSQ